jgi:hypothetical protein
MVSTEIYIEDYKLDLSKELSTEFSYAIDDITDFGSRNTSFSKTISIAGNSTNNRVFGFVFDLGNANFTDNTLPNVNYNYNASKSAQCRIFIDKIQVFKGTLRILEIIIDNKSIEYQCSVFGELGGFITALGNKRLSGNINTKDNLDFSDYDHTYNIANIKASWEVSGARGSNNTNAYGSGYFYPLIDYGNVSTNKINFQVSAYRPALFVKEYIDKIFEGTDYTYILHLESGDQDLYNRLIIPHNQKTLSKLTSGALKVNATNYTYPIDGFYTDIQFGNIIQLGNFTNVGDIEFVYNSSTPLSGYLNLVLVGFFEGTTTGTFELRKNNVIIERQVVNPNSSFNFEMVVDSILFNLNDSITLDFRFDGSLSPVKNLIITGGGIVVNSNAAQVTQINYNDALVINDTIPRGIFQRDFFLSIVKMFNLYVYEDTWNDKKIIIKPYINFYPDTSANALDWSDKIDRSKPLSIKPMSELNARYFNYKFKEDNDFYNENYKKKYNEGYGDRIYDTEYDFSKETDTLDVIFASSVLYQKVGTDKIYPAIYKVSDNNTKENSMDCVIRILQAKKITGRTSYDILNGATILDTITTYGYGGHLNDPFTPTNDINFGVPFDIQFNASTFPSTNLFNVYHSNYIAEITSKDSKLLTCTALLNTLDINNLDFSKYIWIDGVLFRLNSVEGYNPMEYNTTKISLLKVIETTY